MRSVHSSIISAGLITVSAFILFTPAFAKTASTFSTKPASSSDTIQISEKQPGMLYATGEGAMPTVSEQPNRAKAYLQAKAYARAQAIANLMQAIQGTSVVYSASGSNYNMEEQVSQEIEGSITNVEVISERKFQIGKDTVVQVTVQAPKPERWSDKVPRTASAAIPSAKPTRSLMDRSTAVASLHPFIPPASAIRGKEAPYTSVIIDTTGMGVARSMSPKILRFNGSEVWGTVKVDYDFVADHGIVAYARNMPDAYSNERAGDNPLVIRAQRRGPSSYKCDVVLSDDDADYLLSENRQSGFLKDYRVIFVVDASEY